jgi:hypothetical protein
MGAECRAFDVFGPDAGGDEQLVEQYAGASTDFAFSNPQSGKSGDGRGASRLAGARSRPCSRRHRCRRCGRRSRSRAWANGAL